MRLTAWPDLPLGGSCHHLVATPHNQGRVVSGLFGARVHAACLRSRACVMGCWCHLQDAREELHAARAAAGIPNAGPMGAAAEFMDVGMADVDLKEEEQVQMCPRDASCRLYLSAARVTDQPRCL